MKNKRIRTMLDRMAENKDRKEGNIMKRKTVVKVTAGALCAVLALGGTGATLYTLAAGGNTAQNTEADEKPEEKPGTKTQKEENAANSQGTEKDKDKTQKADRTEKDKNSDKTEGKGASDEKLVKEETVYVWTGADGSAKKIIVSDWLKNGAGQAAIEDVSRLTAIENVGGNEIFAEKDNDVKVWEAGGGDIYYQGQTDRELPVELKVTYRLDGKEISPEELAGKSGRVTIRFSYINKQYEYAQLDGVRTKIYVPFAVVTGMVLDNEVFRNVEVSNGRLINDGDRTVVMGYALPGLQENLAVDSDKLDLPDYFELTADAKEFEMGMTATIVTNELFNGVDVDGESLVDDLNEALGELTDAMNQLMDGSSQLYDGLCTLLDKSGELIQGIDALSTGATQLQSGAGALDDGAAKLQNGAATLQAGLNTLVSKNGELNGGARQVFDTLLATARTQLGAAGLDVPAMTVENYGEVLNGVIASLDGDAVYEKAYAQVSAAVETKRGDIEAAVTAVVREQAATQVSAAVRQGVKAKVVEAVRQSVEAEVTEAVRQGVEAKVTEAVRQGVEAKVTEAVRQGVEAKVAAAVREKVTEAVLGQMTPPMTKADYEAAVAAGIIGEEQQTQISAAIDSQMASEAVGAQIAAAVDAQMEALEVRKLIESNVNEQMETPEVRKLIEENVNEQMETPEVRKLIEENVNEQMETPEVRKLTEENVNKQMETADVQALIEANVNEQMAGEGIRETIAANTEQQVQKAIADNMAGDQVQGQLAAASEGVKSVIALKQSLDTYNVFYLGVQAYTAGVVQAADGAGQLKGGVDELRNGTGQLYAGASELSGGIAAMKSSAPALTDGITQLRDGAGKLDDGLREFNDEGIQKLVDAVDDDLDVLVERLRATLDASRRYDNYSGLSDRMEGQVKFIYRTDGIE